jgi:hypothetical protein
MNIDLGFVEELKIPDDGLPIEAKSLPNELTMGHAHQLKVNECAGLKVGVDFSLQGSQVVDNIGEDVPVAQSTPTSRLYIRVTDHLAGDLLKRELADDGLAQLRVGKGWVDLDVFWDFEAVQLETLSVGPNHI